MSAARSEVREAGSEAKAERLAEPSGVRREEITKMNRLLRLAIASIAFVGCKPDVTASVTSIPGHGSLPEDTTPKENPRMVPPEAYIRSYLSLFGGLSPLAAQKALRAGDGSALFDTWNDYLAALGLPDYRVDVPRGTLTNTLMLATFERLGIALCDRALEHDLQGMTPVDQRLIYAFDLPTGAVDQNAFGAGFDVLHRTFLGYPAALAPPDRLPRYFKLYGDTVAAHAGANTRFTPAQAGWAAVCYGLIRHPEFHLY
jgi:hypothetical protein